MHPLAIKARGEIDRRGENGKEKDKTERERKRKGRIKRNKWETGRRTRQHDNRRTDKQKQEKKPTTTSLHHCCPLTFGTRGKGIKPKKQKQRKKPREKV